MTSYEKEMFAILGMKPTKNVAAIERMYAWKIRKYSPEKNYEKWQRIHYAYLKAIDYAKRSNSLVDNSNKYYQTPRQTQEIQPRVQSKAQQRVQPNVQSRVQPKVQSSVQPNMQSRVQPKVQSRVEPKTQLSQSFGQNEQLKQQLMTMMETRWKAPKTKGQSGKIGTIIGILMIMVVILLGDMGIISEVFEELPWIQQVSVSEVEAKEEIQRYMTGKYPDLEMEITSIQEIDFYSWDTDRDKIERKYCGYQVMMNQVSISREGYINVYLYYWQEDKEIQMLCFDDLQKDEITEDMAAYLQTETGVSAGMASLAWNERNLNNYGMKQTQYHNSYDGDLKTFFAKEEITKNTLSTSLIDGAVEKSEDGSNGVIATKAVFLYPDENIQTLKEWFENQGQGATVALQDGVEKVAEELNMEVEAVGIPAGQYAKVQAYNDNRHYAELSFLDKVRSNFSMEESLTGVATMITAYQSTGSENEPMSTPIRELTEGIYIKAATPWLDEHLDVIENMIELEVVEASTEMERAIQEENVNLVPQISYTCRLSEEGFALLEESADKFENQEVILIFDREKLGMTDRYQIGINTHYKAVFMYNEDVSIYDEERSFIKQFAPYTKAIGIEGYLIVKLEISDDYKEQILTLAN